MQSVLELPFQHDAGIVLVVQQNRLRRLKPEIHVVVFVSQFSSRKKNVKSSQVDEVMRQSLFLQQVSKVDISSKAAHFVKMFCRKQFSSSERRESLQRVQLDQSVQIDDFTTEHSSSGVKRVSQPNSDCFC